MKRTKRYLAMLLAVLVLAASLTVAFAEETAADPAAETTTVASEATSDASETTTTTEPAATEPATSDTSAPAEEPSKTDSATEPAKEETSTDAAEQTPTSEGTDETPTTTPAPILSAKSGTCGEGIAWTLNTDGQLLISGIGEIASYSQERNVPWSSEAAQIKSVVVSDGITAIGDRAFSGCTALTQVSMPVTLKTIGGWAFNGCASLLEITLPEGLTDISWYAFCGCKGLKEMIFPDSVKSIGASVLSECNHLTNVKLPAGLTCIDYYLFRMCHGLRQIKIPATVTEICGGAFHNCVNLAEVSVPRSVTAIGDYAFLGCENLTRVSVYNGQCKIPEDNRVFPAKTVLRGYEGSTLEAFAKANDRTFETMADIPEHEHVWESPVDTTPATCLSTGVRTYTCSVCGETKEEETPITEHNPVTVPSVPATCKQTGLTEGVVCGICGMVFTPQAILPKTGHTWKNKVTAAKIGKNGKVVSTCTVCKTTKTETVAKINSVKLSETQYIADGKAKKPTVTIKDSNNSKLKKNEDDTLKYSSGRKNVGVYTVTVTFKGNYAGTKTLKFKVIPGRVTNLKVKAQSGRKFLLTWDKVTGAKKYAVYYATSKNGDYKKLGSFSKNSLTTTNYTAGKTYYFKVRAVTTVDGTNHFGAYSLVKHAKAKR